MFRTREAGHVKFGLQLVHVEYWPMHNRLPRRSVFRVTPPFRFHEYMLILKTVHKIDTQLQWRVTGNHVAYPTVPTSMTSVTLPVTLAV